MMSKFKSIKHTFASLTHEDLLTLLPFECAYYPRDEKPEYADVDTIEFAMIFAAANYAMKPYTSAQPPIN